MSDTFTFDGISSAAYGVYVYPTDSMYQAPARQYTVLTVPGRSGALLIDENRFDNTVREYGVVIPENGRSNIDGLRNALASRVGYFRLTDTFDSTHYYMAMYDEDFMPTIDWHGLSSKVVLTFTRKPQRFLLSGETAVVMTSSGTITNPTRFASKPLLVVTTTRSTGSVLGVGSTNITIRRQGVTYIDCETGRAYNGATPYDTYISLNTIDFPTLNPGSNGITLGTGISRVEITPRWWEI